MIEALKTRVRHFIAARQKDGTMPYWALVDAAAAVKNTKLSDSQLAAALEAASKTVDDLEQDVALTTQLAEFERQAATIDGKKMEAARLHAEANASETRANAMRLEAQQLAERSAALRNAGHSILFGCEDASRRATDVRRQLRDRGRIEAGEAAAT